MRWDRWLDEVLRTKIKPIPADALPAELITATDRYKTIMKQIEKPEMETFWNEILKIERGTPR